MIHDPDATGSPKHSFAETLFSRPSVRILFYTDDDTDLVLMDKSSEFGVGRLAELIKESTPSYVRIEIDFIRRHDGGHAAHKLTAELVGQYDEIWFFGLKLANTASAAENELTDAEISALSTWMNTGGTLMTGDHANPRPSNVDPSLDSLLNLGRAIGHRVPRAGKLRRWEGQPGADLPDNYNTHAPVQFIDIEDLELDSDGNPQQLILKKFPVHGRFDFGTTIPTRWRPHPLFCGRQGVIDIFPDHMHEGHLVIPKPEADWPTGPSGIQPMPEIVAWGVDSRNARMIGVVSAYDGDQGGVGRIVADSTWHHYFNMNLQGFPRLSTDMSQGYQLRILADYYVNLVVWLAPIAKRSAMRNRLLWDIATHGSVFEVKGNSYRTLGKAGLSVLGYSSSQCFGTDLIFSSYSARMAGGSGRGLFPSEEFLMGGIIDQFHKALETRFDSQNLDHTDELIEAGIAGAFEFYIEWIGGLQQQLKTGYELFRSQVNES